eukprot:TRINITY_DN402_c0_g2_i3.p1 TRINITY_DN402_c0_g2~~TRINITY_DN402_c0_g2_i3.p1  ORF type:complete len:116 (-),score=30.48 TRINITY_DN402_c0_g2_i3:186-533(-)
MSNSKEADDVIDALNGRDLDERRLTVEKSKRGGPRKPTPGRYLGKTNNRYDRDRYDRGGRRGDRYDRDRDRERYYRRSPNYRDYSPRRRSPSRSRSRSPRRRSPPRDRGERRSRY